AEIAKGINLRQIADELRLPLNGSPDQNKQLITKQEGYCTLIFIMLKGRDDLELRKVLINTGISDSLLYIFESRNLPSVTKPFTDAYSQLTVASNEIRQLLFNKKPYFLLLRLLNHSDNQVINNAILSISNLLAYGCDTTPVSQPHPHFAEMEQNNGTKQLFSLFKTSNIENYARDTAAICIGRLYKAKDIPMLSMRVEIIQHLKNLLGSANENISINSKYSLSDLTQSIQNHKQLMRMIDLKQIAEEIRRPFVGQPDQKREILNIQHGQCSLLYALTENRKDDDLRKALIAAGIADALLFVFNSRELNQIDQPFTDAFFQLTYADDDVNLILVDKQPFHLLIRLLGHANNRIVNDALLSISNLLLAGTNTTSHSTPHPHYAAIAGFSGDKQLHSLFKRKDVEQQTRDWAAICIGRMYRAREIPVITMRTEILQHLKTILGCSDENISINSKYAISDLAQNPANYKEIMKGIDMFAIAEELRKPISGPNDQKKKLLSTQEGQCSLLYIILKGRKDEALRKTMIDSEVADSLLFVFETRDLQTITKPISDAFFQLTVPCSDELKLMLYDKKPYPGLLRLLNHKDSKVIKDTILSISNILLAGTNTTAIDAPHPHFDVMMKYNGVEQLFTLFQRTDVEQQARDWAAICIGRLFRANEIPKQQMRTEIINHLKTIICNTVENIRVNSKYALVYLAQNSVNYNQIKKVIDMKSIAAELRKPLVGNEEYKKEILNRQEGQCNLLTLLIENKDDDDLRKDIIDSGIADSLLFIFETRIIPQITEPFTEAFFQITVAGDEVNLLLYEKSPYPYLIQILNHPNDIIQMHAINSIFNILLAGTNTTESLTQHPHFDVIFQFEGIQKLVDFFLRPNVDKSARDWVAICIGRLYRSKEIPDNKIKIQLIAHLKSLLTNIDEKLSVNAKYSLSDLSQDKANLTEVKKGIEMKQVAQDLRKSLTTDNDANDDIILAQEGQCNFLYSLIENRKDDEFRKGIIKSGVADSLLFVFESRKLQQITESYIDLFLQLTVPCGDEVKQMLFVQKPYPALLKLFGHTDPYIIKLAALSIFNILGAGINSTPASTPHPHFEVMQQLNGIDKLFTLFRRADVDNYTIDTAAVCIGRLFRAKEITNPTMAKAIFTHLKSLINDPDQRTK
ncbi:MAG: hypothetical protein EZS28_027771, partial [Streblomastix strix]